MADDTTDYAWRVEAGEREILNFSIQNAEGETTPIPGWSVDAKIYDRPGGNVLYTFPSADAALVGGGAGIRLKIPAAVSAAWQFTSAWYRVVVTDPVTVPADPDTQRVLQGTLVVDPG